MERLIAGRERLVTGAEALQEILHRYILYAGAGYERARSGATPPFGCG